MGRGKNPERIWKFIQFGKKIPKGYLITDNLETPCWNWIGALNHHDYGVYTYDFITHYAHRFVYEYLIGKIPKGKQIDHLCRNPRCVNPEHLEPVTSLENSRRGLKSGNAIKTHCKRGHEFTPENSRYWKSGNGAKVCRACDIARWKIDWVKRKAKMKEIKL